MKTMFKIEITMVFLLALSFGCLAQRTESVSAEEKRNQAQKADKGQSALCLGWKVNGNEYFEDKAGSGFGSSFDLGYEYFVFNRTSFIGKVGLMTFGNSRESQREAYALISVRRYFFKRAGFFAEAGCQIGSFRELFHNGDGSQEFRYCLPACSVGYEYLVTNLHPVLDNHLGIEASLFTLIPTKSYDEFTITEFPAIDLCFKIKWHF